MRTEDVLTYIRLLSEVPGIVDRIKNNALTKHDDEVILKYFPNIDRFMYVARFAYGKTVDQLMNELNG